MLSSNQISEVKTDKNHAVFRSSNLKNWIFKSSKKPKFSTSPVFRKVCGSPMVKFLDFFASIISHK